MANRIPSDFRLPSFRSFEALDDGRPPSRMQALTASPERSHQQAAQHPQQTTRPNLPSGRTSLPSIPQLISRPSIGSSTDLPMHDSPRQWAATKSQAAATLPSPSRQPVLQSTQPLEDSSSRRETAESKSFAHPFFDRGRKPHLLRSPSFEEGKGKQKTIEGNPLEEAYVALSAAAELCANAVKEERRFLSTAAHDAAVAAAERAWRILRDSGPKVYRSESLLSDQKVRGSATSADLDNLGGLRLASRSVGEPYPPVLNSLVSQESDLHHSSGTISLPAIAEKRPKEMDGFSSRSIFGLSDSARSHAVNNSFPHHHPVHTPRLAKDGVYEAQGPDVSTVDLDGSTANISPRQADVDGASPTLPIPQGIHGDGPPRPPVAVARVQRSTTHEESHQQLAQEDAHMDQEEASYMYAPPGIRNRLAKMRQQQPSVMAPSPPKKEIQQPRPVESAAPSQAGSVLRSSGDSNASSSSMRHLPASRESISSPRASGLPGHSTVEGIDKTRPAMYRHVSQRSDGHDHPLHYPLEGSGEASTASNSPDNTVKYKKRSRAPAPESCKSCGTTETPEWRRGPDGARTLCNACGLHFAKLAKKTDAPCDARAPATAQRSTQQPIVQQSQQHPYSHPSHHYPAHQTSQPIKTLPPMMMPSALYHQEQQQQQQQDASSRTQMPHHPLSHSSIQQQQQQQHQQQSHFYTQSPRQQSFDSRGPGSASSPRAPRYPSDQQHRR